MVCTCHLLVCRDVHRSPMVLGSVLGHGLTPKFYKQDQVRGRPARERGRDQHQVEEKECKSDVQGGKAAPGICAVCVCVSVCLCIGGL